MAQIIRKTTAEGPDKQNHFNNQSGRPGEVQDIKNFNSGAPASLREPDFAELHALFESHYEQFLTDTSDEISKCHKRLMQLESIVYGNAGSQRIV
jgi:hypothetical protein